MNIILLFLASPCFAVGNYGSNNQSVINAPGTSLSVSGSTIAASFNDFFSSQTFVSVGSGTIVNIASTTVKSFAIQVTGINASPTSWDVRLNASLDGASFTQILQHVTATGNSQTLYSGANFYPSRYFRVDVSSLVVGAASGIVIQTLGTP